MRPNIHTIAIATFALAVVFAIGWQTGRSGNSIGPIADAESAGGVVSCPNIIARDRYVYYPGTEVLAIDEVRVIACGTGMPEQRRGTDDGGAGGHFLPKLPASTRHHHAGHRRHL